MNIKQYEIDCERTRFKLNKTNRLVHAGLGITAEAGEFSDLVKKRLYHGHTEDRQQMIEELGDILFYIFEAADSLETDLDEIMQANMAKRKKRYPEGFNSETSRRRYE